MDVIAPARSLVYVFSEFSLQKYKKPEMTWNKENDMNKGEWHKLQGNFYCGTVAY